MKPTLALCLALTACADFDISPQHLSQLDRQDCSAYGFTPSTENWSNCLMTEHNARIGRLEYILSEP